MSALRPGSPAEPGQNGPKLDPDALRWLTDLVALAPTNLEETARERYEKPNYPKVARYLETAARELGLPVRRYDPTEEAPARADLRGIPRPNLAIDLDRGADRWVLVMAHYDVVPVPAEQLGRWKSPPFTLTAREDGRLYGRGANDDLGSGVVASLLALKRLEQAKSLPRNVRLLLCCDEETGGLGGIEAVRARDEELPAEERWLLCDVALIPDGNPHVTVGSSGVMFLDAGFAKPVPLPTALDYGRTLVALHQRVALKRSRYPSPDWPAHGAPAPNITGRATVTQFDAETLSPPGGGARLLRVHAETAATNQIPQVVTLLFEGTPEDLEALPRRLALVVEPPFQVGPAHASGIPIPPGVLAIALVGTGAHGGSPHLAHNPVPVALELIARAAKSGWIDDDSMVRATFGIDLRLIPEASMETERDEVLAAIRAWAASHSPDARIEAPEGRSRGGYALSPDHPEAVRFEAIAQETLGEAGFFGEYGGTDASSLAGLRTPKGAPLPALVFGSMDRAANIHLAEESVDPALLERVTTTIERFVREA